MRTRTRQALLQAATAAAVICTAALVFIPAQAAAAPASASTTVNVRSGPGTSYGVVDTLSAGENVDVLGCRSGWCYIDHSGPDGYVSASYLRRGGAAMQPDFNLSFNFPNGGGISIGTGGVSIGVGTPDRPDRPNRPGGGNFPGNGEACFYTGAGYTGSSFCMDRGDSKVYVGGAWNNRISSIRNPGGLRVTVCDDSGYDDCRTYTTSVRDLGSFDNRISSIRVR